MWLILGPILAVAVGAALIVARMAFQQREQDRKAKKWDSDVDSPVFMIGFTDKK